MEIKQLLKDNKEFWPVVGPEAVKFPDNKTLTDFIEDVSNEMSSITESIPSLQGLFSSVEYNSDEKKLEFQDVDGNIVNELDVSDFVRDGMVDSVKVDEGNLVITFNSDSGKETVYLPITSIFNADNYYTKEDVDNRLTEILNDIETITENEIDAIINTIFE